MELDGAVATVTGAASGIGRACALAFAQQGADIVISDIRDEAGMQVVAEVEALGRKARYVSCDVSEQEQVESLVGASISWQGHCDVFMSNAGIGMGGAPHMIPMEEWDRILAINLHSHIWAVREILPHMLERGSGHLVHTASSAGTLGFAQLIPYCVTKFGVVGLAESLAMYVRDRGLGVSVICPLLVATNIFERSTNFPEEPVDEATQAKLDEFAQRMMTDGGIPPEQVADDVVTAVRENHLYVFPHPELKDMIDNKWKDPDAWIANASRAWKTQQEATQQLLSSL